MQLSGRRLLHYEVVEPIADGGTWDLYKALDTRTDRFVALRILRPEEVADADRTRRFEQDARTASALNHPNIATIHDITSEGPFHFVVMESLAGYTPLGTLTGERFSASEALRYAIPIAGALAAAHRAGIVHGQLAPSNIMLGDQDRVKVLDFGVAAMADGALVTGGAASIARPVMTNEPRSGWDRYCLTRAGIGTARRSAQRRFLLGAILYEMLTGRRPFAGVFPASPLMAIGDDRLVPVHELGRCSARARGDRGAVPQQEPRPSGSARQSSCWAHWKRVARSWRLRRTSRNTAPAWCESQTGLSADRPRRAGHGDDLRGSRVPAPHRRPVGARRAESRKSSSWRVRARSARLSRLRCGSSRSCRRTRCSGSNGRRSPARSPSRRRLRERRCFASRSTLLMHLGNGSAERRW